MFAAVAVALYAGHHVGDYWVQTDTQARRKGERGRQGVLHCLQHVMSYMATQWVCVVVTLSVLGLWQSIVWWHTVAGLALSGVTHYVADRREPLKWMARHVPGKAAFLELGVPREPRVVEAWFDCSSCEGRGVGGAASDESTGGKCWDCRGGGRLPSALTLTDAPQLATGLWALDQSWHIFWGVFVAALVMSS